MQRGSGFLRVGLVKCDPHLEELGPGQLELRPLQRRSSCRPAVTGSEPRGRGLSPPCRFSQTPQEVQLSRAGHPPGCRGKHNRTAQAPLPSSSLKLGAGGGGRTPGASLLPGAALGFAHVM